MAQSMYRPTRVLASGTMAKLYPLWGAGKPMTFWAEGGVVCYFDEGKGKYGSMFWQDAAKRAIALSEMVTNSSDGGYANERMKLQQFVCDMELVIRNAREQSQEFDAIVSHANRAARHRVRQAQGSSGVHIVDTTHFDELVRSW